MESSEQRQGAMKFDSISGERASIWFSADELGFLRETLAWALKELDSPDEFHLHTGRLDTYAREILVVLRNASERVAAFQGVPDDISRMIDARPFVQAQAPDTHTTELRATMRLAAVSKDQALLSLTDHELRLLNNVVNEVAHGLRSGSAFLRALGKTVPYARHLIDQLVDGNEKIRELRRA